MKKKSKAGQTVVRLIDRIFGLFLAAGIVFGIFGLALEWILLKGPSPALRDSFVMTMIWTRRFDFINNIFLTQEEIDGIYSAADKAKEDADQMKQEYTERMMGAREEADRLVRNAVDTAQNRGDAIVKEAQAEAAHMKQKAENEIEQEKRKAYSELMGEISGMAADIAGRMVEREINPDDHRELVEEFIKSAGEAS